MSDSEFDPFYNLCNDDSDDQASRMHHLCSLDSDSDGEDDTIKCIIDNYTDQDSDNEEGVETEIVEIKDKPTLSIEDQRAQWTTVGLSGFENMGNTCYMNSVLQCICNTGTLMAMFLNDIYYTKLKEVVKKNIIKKLGKRQRVAEKKESNENVSINMSDIYQEQENAITHSLKLIFDNRWNNKNINPTIKPKSFKKIVSKINREFIGFGQKDSQELIDTLLNGIHEETIMHKIRMKYNVISQKIKNLQKIIHEYVEILNSSTTSQAAKEDAKAKYDEYMTEHFNAVIERKSYVEWKKYLRTNYSIITQLFTGLQYSSVVCKNCGRISVKFDAINTIRIPLEECNSTTLKQCLKKYSDPELLTGDEQYQCDICRTKTDAVKQIYIWEPPEKLIIQLKRFKQQGIRLSKNMIDVTFPLTGLELTDNFSGLHPHKNCVYDLYAVIHHGGGLHGGHYTAYCKHPSNSMWYYYNDDSVYHVPMEDIERRALDTTDSYILFYERVYGTPII